MLLFWSRRGAGMTHVKTPVIRETMMNALKVVDTLSRLKLFALGMDHPLLLSARAVVVQRVHIQRRVGEGRKERNCKCHPNIPTNTHILHLRQLNLSSNLRLLQQLQCQISPRKNGRGGPIITANARRRVVRRASVALLASININMQRDPVRQRTVPALPGLFNHRQLVRLLVKSCDLLMRIMMKELQML
jgi:hypothetical protein